MRASVLPLVELRIYICVYTCATHASPRLWKQETVVCIIDRHYVELKMDNILPARVDRSLKKLQEFKVTSFYFN